MSELEMNLISLSDEIEEAKDNLSNILMNTEKEELDRCKGWVESVEGYLNEAESDIDFALSLLKNNQE